MSPTLIWRHKRENRKKCSLRGLETRKDFYFVSYPNPIPLNLKTYLVLDVQAPLLTEKDTNYSILLLDGTWRYTSLMKKNLPSSIEKRSLPSHFVTAYPRKQEDCPDPKRGLASIEALFLAFWILGKNAEGLLDNYFWKDLFLERNNLKL